VRVSHPLFRAGGDLLYKEFTKAFAEMARAVKVGDGLDPANQMGPLANPRRIETMEAMVANATAKGARLLAGGTRIGRAVQFSLHEV
jgi:succinate-semialdehyde dehydrogenase / glutarate-semialdehyde dehydrogenase